jgi:DNA-binding transcriptional regulator YbjK
MHSELQDVLLECSKAGVTVDFDTSNCTWADVIRQMEKAQNTYKAKADKNRIRAVFRRGQRISTAMETWLDVIPDQFGLNVLHAGLTLIFQVRGTAKLSQ